MPNEGYVYLGLFGTFQPDQLTARIGIEPTSSCEQGGRNRSRRLPRSAIWEYSTERFSGERLDVYELAERVTTDLEPYSSPLGEAIAEHDLRAVLQVVLYFSTNEEASTPPVGFSSRVLAFLSDINASIDIDTYLSD